MLKKIITLSLGVLFSSSVVWATEPANTVTMTDKTVTLERCAIKGHEFTNTSKMSLFKAIQAVDSHIVIADGSETLVWFKLDAANGCVLEKDTSVADNGMLKLPRKIEVLSASKDGLLIASNGIFSSYLIKEGKLLGECESGYLHSHSSSTWAFSSWVNSNTKIIKIADNKCSKQDWKLVNMTDDAKRQGDFSQVNTSNVIGDSIFVGGVWAKKVGDSSPRVVQVYDKAGAIKYKFGLMDKPYGDEAFGWVHDIEACGASTCVLDSNYRKITRWSADGKFQGIVKFDKDHGFDYPWLNDMTTTNNMIFVLLADSDKDKKTYGTVVKLSGF